MIINKKIPLGYLIGRLKYKILLVFVLATVMGVSGDLIDKYANIKHPIGIPAFVGTALVFILAFRTNQAYERWWEARKIWGAIVNDSRSFSRMVLTLISPECASLKEKLIYRQIGWNYILVNRLRKHPLEAKELAYFSKKERDQLKHAFNANQLILKLQSEDLLNILKNKQIYKLHHFEIENVLSSLEASMGKAERIKNTQFPVLYDLLILTAIYIFSALLSLAIVDSAHIFEIVFTVIVSTIFLALEQISLDMQDPFEDLPSDTPITHISHTIERGLLQLMDKTDMPETPTFGKFWIK